MENTRIDRLLLLIDRGSSNFIRRSAADQLADGLDFLEVDLPVLLQRLQSLLRSRSWDTRIAAGYALERLAAHVPRVLLSNGQRESQQATAMQIDGTAEHRSPETDASALQLQFHDFEIN